MASCRPKLTPCSLPPTIIFPVVFYCNCYCYWHESARQRHYIGHENLFLFFEIDQTNVKEWTQNEKSWKIAHSPGLSIAECLYSMSALIFLTKFDLIWCWDVLWVFFLKIYRKRDCSFLKNTNFRLSNTTTTTLNKDEEVKTTGSWWTFKGHFGTVVGAISSKNSTTPRNR